MLIHSKDILVMVSMEKLIVLISLVFVNCASYLNIELLNFKIIAKPYSQGMIVFTSSPSLHLTSMGNNRSIN